MGSKTCTTLIIHLDFKLDSPFQSILEISSTDHSVSDASISVSEDQTYVVQPINDAQPENTLQTAIDTLLNKPTVLKLVIQPVPKPIFDISNMDISDSDEEEEHVFHVDSNLGSASTLEPELDIPLSSPNQPIQDLPSTSSPKTVNVSPPPTLLLDSIVLREFCENIFEDLNKLVKAKNDPVHTENYEDKWIALGEVLDRVLCDLQRLSVEA